MNGKPGDHPITDIMRHRIAVYGEPLDTQLRELGDLMSYPRLCDWFEQHWSLSAQQLQPLVAAKLEELRRDAETRGWEKPLRSRLFRIGALLLLAVALASRLIPLVFESPVNRSSENLRLAGQFIAAHENEIHADPRFRNVHFGLRQVRPGGHWSPAYCIRVIGNVGSENDAQDLKRLLIAKRPPVQLSYQLDVSASRDTDLTNR